MDLSPKNRATHGPAKQDPTSLVQSIRAKASDPSLVDDDEPLPNSAVVDAAAQFVSALYALMDPPPPPAAVGMFFGELNITWRSGNRMVRVAFFPDRPTLLAFGALSEPAGSYRSESNPSLSEVAARLAALAPALV